MTRATACAWAVWFGLLVACGEPDRAAFDARLASFTLAHVDADLDPGLPTGTARLFVTMDSIAYDPSPDERAAHTAAFEIPPADRAQLADRVPHEPHDALFGRALVGHVDDARTVLVLADARVPFPSLVATLEALARPSLLAVRAPRGVAVLAQGGLCPNDAFDPSDDPTGDRLAEYTTFVSADALRLRIAYTDYVHCAPQPDTASHVAPDGDLIVADVEGVTHCFSSEIVEPNASPSVVADWDVDVQRAMPIAAALVHVGWSAVVLCAPHPGMPWQTHSDIPEPIAAALEWREAPLSDEHVIGLPLAHRDATLPAPETIAEPREVSDDDDDLMATWLRTRAPFHPAFGTTQRYVRARDRDGRDILVFEFAATQDDRAYRGVSIFVDGELVSAIGPVHPATDADATALLVAQLMIDAPASACEGADCANDPCVSADIVVPTPSEPSARRTWIAHGDACTDWRAYEATFDASGAPVTRIGSIETIAPVE